jgi:hypothetical protein
MKSSTTATSAMSAMITPVRTRVSPSAPGLSSWNPQSGHSVAAGIDSPHLGHALFISFPCGQFFYVIMSGGVFEMKELNLSV